MKIQTKSFTRFSSKLGEVIDSSAALKKRCDSTEAACECMDESMREVLLNSEYAEGLTPDQNAFALRIFKAGRLCSDIVQALIAVPASGEAGDGHEAQCRCRFCLSGWIPKILSTHDAAREDGHGHVSRHEQKMPTEDVKGKIEKFLAEVDALVAESFPDEPSYDLPKETKSPLLTERFCLFFQNLLGTLHRQDPRPFDLACLERQVVSMLQEEGISVMWPSADLRTSTPEFRVVVVPSAASCEDTLPCLRWRDSWLAGERAVPTT